jgi:glycosyltransferase involved in cell wall biosynthesis
VRLFQHLLWQASTEGERRDILRSLGGQQDIKVSRNIAIARDIVGVGESQPILRHLPKERGTARFVFLSRVSPMKNLRTAIELIGSLSGRVSLDIFGPADDAKYLRECQAATAGVRANVNVAWHGAVKPADVTALIAKFDFFILPTLGENFGHVILESLCVGCPVLLSDRTPWSSIEADGAGWILSLEQRERWMDVLQRCVEMDSSAHEGMRQRARILAQRFDDRETTIRQNVALFEAALRLHGAP